jgi:DNA replicative helicase MCM subunit Mcm2 (Cdc46/Mcm family)
MEARQIEGMIRNCKSRAKCYMQTEVTPQMVDEEIELFNACLASINFEIKDNTLQSTFGEVKLSKQKAFIKAIKQLRDEETGLFHRDELEDHLVNAYSETFPTIHDVRTFWENTGVNIVKKDHTTLQWLLR